jgi:hypothetical protein
LEGETREQQKTDNFLTSRQGVVLFFRNSDKSARAFHERRGLMLKAANDSGMAPQAIEIAQNGLGFVSLRSGGRNQLGEVRLPPEGDAKKVAQKRT